MLKYFLSAALLLSAGFCSQSASAQAVAQTAAQITTQKPVAGRDTLGSPQLVSTELVLTPEAISPEKEALVREYLTVTQSNELALQMMESMVPVFQQAYPVAPPEFFEAIMAEMASGESINLLVPVFAENLTIQELEAAIAFYRTPEGQSILRKTPMLMQQSQQVGAIWGEQVGERILRELESQGYLESRADWSEL